MCAYTKNKEEKNHHKVQFSFNADSHSIWANTFKEDQAGGTTDGLDLQLWYHIVILITKYF